MVPLLGAIVGCHCSVLWLGGEGDEQLEDVPLQGAIVVWVTTNFGGVDVVPLLGAIAGCHSSVLWLGREGDDQLWGKWACWVPLQGANLCFMSSFYIQGHQFHPGTQENNNEFCLEFLADVTFFSMLITQKMFFLLSGVYAGIILYVIQDIYIYVCFIKYVERERERDRGREREMQHQKQM